MSMRNDGVPPLFCSAATEKDDGEGEKDVGKSDASLRTQHEEDFEERNKNEEDEDEGE